MPPFSWLVEQNKGGGGGGGKLEFEVQTTTKLMPVVSQGFVLEFRMAWREYCDDFMGGRGGRGVAMPSLEELQGKNSSELVCDALLLSYY